MAATLMATTISPKLLRVMERAKRDPQTQFLSLAHLIEEGALQRAYNRLRKDAAAGVDGMTKDMYGEHLAENVRSLHQRLRTKRWRHQAVRRVHIPKGQGKTRPIGISSTEDKVVQGALCEILGIVYEPVFKDCSYGFRPGRGAHGALRSLNQGLFKGEINWILEADIKSFFDDVNRKMLMEMLRERVADGALLRLIGKCLHVGVLDGVDYSTPDMGTVQGSALSPLLGNVYLHHVLDDWFESVVLPRMRGKVRLVRYADDFAIGFQREDDARRVMAVLGQRFARFGLTLHPDKTRLIPFGRPSRGAKKGPATFDFLGFTHYWVRARSGRWVPRVKTRTASLRRAIASVAEWCRRHRHLPVKEQHAALKRRIVGHFNYFGINGNIRSLWKLVHAVVRLWHKWLNRRSQRARLTWDRFNDMQRDYPLPSPRIAVQIW